MTASVDQEVIVVEHASVSRRSLPMWLRGGSPAWIWVGVVAIVAGFALIAIAWGQVAGETQVALQLPYVVSAGLTGLAVITVGLLVLDLACRHRDAIEGDLAVERLTLVIEELGRRLDEQEAHR